MSSFYQGKWARTENPVGCSIYKTKWQHNCACLLASLIVVAHATVGLSPNLQSLDRPLSSRVKVGAIRGAPSQDTIGA